MKEVSRRQFLKGALTGTAAKSGSLDLGANLQSYLEGFNKIFGK